MEVINTFCDECCQRVDAEVISMREVVPMRGMEIAVDSEWPICPECGNRIANAAVMERNDVRLYEEYRRLAGIPTGDEIRDARKALGLSQRQLAELLGIGMASLQRYEGGKLPTEAHATMMKRLRDPLFLRELLQGACSVDPDEKMVMAKAIESISSPAQEEASLSRAVLTMMSRVPGEYTGNQSFDAARFREVLVYLANHVNDLFRTKLNKVLFYLDFSMFRDHGQGVTGLRYAHADYGPVPDKYEQLIPVFADGEALWFEEDEGGGQVLCTGRDADLSLFSASERAQLERVVEFADAFPTATALTNASHEEDAWKDAGSGALIPYSSAATLKGVASAG